jgi:hypothetical protein
MEKLIQNKSNGERIEASFIHIPKTGGTTITHLLRGLAQSNAGVTTEPLNMLNGHSMSHIYKKYISDRIKGTHHFCIVRNPITWYESVYKMIISYSKDHTDLDFKHTRVRGFNPIGHATFMYAPTFEKFIDNMLRQAPDYYFEVCQHYMGKNLDEIPYVGYTETLFKDVYVMLEDMGFEFSREQIINAPSHGGRQHLNDRIKWRAGQKAKILEANKMLAKSHHFEHYFKK